LLGQSLFLTGVNGHDQSETDQSPRMTETETNCDSGTRGGAEDDSPLDSKVTHQCIDVIRQLIPAQRPGVDGTAAGAKVRGDDPVSAVQPADNLECCRMVSETSV
jgi:hypothetical protein